MSSVVATLGEVNEDLSNRIDQQDQQISSISKRYRVRTEIGDSSKATQDQKISELSGSLRDMRRALDVVVESIGSRVDAHEEQLARIRAQVSSPSGVQSSSVGSLS